VAAEPRNPALEDVIRAAPDELAGYKVLADWLEEQGHPRAALIRAQLAEPQHGQALLAEHGAALLDPALARSATLTWRHGFVRRAEIDADPAAIAAVFTDAGTRFLDELVVRSKDRRTDEVLEALNAATPMPTLRGLELDLVYDRELALSRFFGDLFAPIERLRLAGHWAFDDLVAPAVIEALFATSPVHTSYRAIARAPWPALRSLEIRFDGAYDTTSAALEPLFARADLAALRRLALPGVTSAQAVTWLARAPFVRQLRELSLRDAGLTDAQARRLGAAKRLAELEVLDLGEHELSPDGLAALATLAPRARIDGSRRPRRTARSSRYEAELE
jgi:uncharacterized protein (TIGR02996 family)